MKPLYVKKNGVVYRVSGTGIPSIYPAANVEYDNTVTSELQATDVQSAIDELSTREAGVQSDWDEDDSAELDYIKNKPQNLVQDASYVHTDNNYDATAKGKVDALGTAASKNVPTSGNASTTEVVMGDDTRLTDARPASDVSAWAKASTKPTYTASEVGAIASTLKGSINGVAELDAAGKVPSSQLPSFVDDVIEVADYDHLPITGESGKIYVTLDTNKTYRWTGSGYAEISESLALGETSATAYRGDRGKTAYDHAIETKLSTATASGLYKVAATAQGHISSLTAVEKSDITALGIPGQDTIIKNTAYGTCDTAGDVKDKVATLVNATNWVLEVGTIVGIKFTYTNTCSLSGISLNVNNTGAKEIRYSDGIWIGGVDTKCPTAFGEANQTIYYMYDGTDWVWISHSKDNDTTYAFEGNTFRSEDGSNYYHGDGTNGNANNMTTNGHYYYKTNGPSTAIGAYGNDGAMFVQAYDSDNIAQIAQNYENGNLFVRGKANGTWTDWKKPDAGTINGLTVQTAVPADAVFTDTNNAVTQTNLANSDTNARRVILSGSANDTSETKGVYKNTQLQFTPSTGVLNSPKLTAKINNSALTGTGTAAQDKGSGVSPRYFPAKWQFNTGYNPSEGDIIIITLPCAGHGWGDWISINNGSTWHPANFQGTGRLTTHFGSGQVIAFIFDADGSTASMTPVNGADSVNGSTITGGCWRVLNMYDSNTDVRPSAYCDTAAATAAKAASCTNYNLLDKSYLHVTMVYANTSASAITLNVNGKGAKAIYINGAASSASNYTLPAGTYLVYYASNIYYFRTDGKITGDITGNAATVNGLTVQTAVPANAVFTDTKYNFGGTTFYSGNGSNAEHNANSIQYNGVYYYSSNGPSTAQGASTADGALYAEAHSTTWVGQIAQDYRNGNLWVRGKNNGTLQYWKGIVTDDILLSLVPTANKFLFNPIDRKIIANKSTSAWDSQVYSKNGYTTNCQVSWKPAQTNMAIMFGLDNNPTQDANFNTIDYCWYTQNNGGLSIFENGTSISAGSGHTTYAAGDDLRIEYANGVVKYYHNGVCCRSVARAISGKLYVDSSFHGASGAVYDFYFGPTTMDASSVNGLILSLVT